MATVTFTIKQNGTPLVGAEFNTSNDKIDETLTTDTNGRVIVTTLPEDFASVVFVSVRHSLLPITAYIAVGIVEAGSSYELNVPDYHTIEGGGELRGIHCHFLPTV